MKGDKLTSFEDLGRALDLPAVDHSLLNTRVQTRKRAAKGPADASRAGRKVQEWLIPVLAQNFRDNLARGSATAAPRGLEQVIRRLSPEQYAVLVTRVILNQLYRPAIGAGRKKQRGHPTPAVELRLNLGRLLRDELEFAGLVRDGVMQKHILAKARPSQKRGITPKRANLAKRSALGKLKGMDLGKFRTLDWTNRECARAGDWLLVVTRDDLLVEDGCGAIDLASDLRDAIDELAEALVFSHPVYMPMLTRPPDWTSWRTNYDKHISATFVRARDPETEAAIKAAFDDGSVMPHAAAISALQRVPLKVNAGMIPLLEKFAGDEYRRDVKVAHALAGQPFWNRIRCDRRGRLIQICDFNYTRGDPVRSLFLFANGKKVGDDDGIGQLKIAVANAYGIKGTREERHAWVDGHHELIKAVAAEPELVWLRDTKDGKPKEPFLFVAACAEYASAVERGAHYVTHLPVWLDASSNGLQHLALIGRDVDLALKVNLQPIDQGGYDDYEPQPRDIYAEVHRLGRGAAADPLWEFWHKHEGHFRDLFKSPIMTLSYGATKRGMFNQIKDKCEELGIKAPPDEIARLRDLICKHIEKELPGAVRIMEFVQELAMRLLRPGRVDGFPPRYRAPPGTFMSWVTPSGFPVANRYYESKEDRVSLPFLGARPVIADGYTDWVRHQKVKNSAVANLVHSLDAAHLCRSVNQAVAEGITDIMTVHDCYATLAPDVGSFARVRRWALAGMYEEWDPLPRLLEANGVADLALPERDAEFNLTAVANYSTYFDR